MMNLTSDTIVNFFKGGKSFHDFEKEWGTKATWEQVNSDLQTWSISIPFGSHYLRVVEEVYPHEEWVRIYWVKNNPYAFEERWGNMIYERQDA